MEEQRQYRAERQASLDRRAKDQAANLDSDPATEETHRWDRLMAAQLEAAKTKAAQELCAVERVAVGYSKEDVSRWVESTATAGSPQPQHTVNANDSFQDLQ